MYFHLWVHGIGFLEDSSNSWSKLKSVHVCMGRISKFSAVEIDTNHCGWVGNNVLILWKFLIFWKKVSNKMEMKIIKYCIWSPKMFKPVKFYTEKGRFFLTPSKYSILISSKCFFQILSKWEMFRTGLFSWNNDFWLMNLHLPKKKKSSLNSY